MDINIKEQTVVTENELTNTHGIVYDMGDDDGPITKLPNANSILDQVLQLLECMSTEEMQVLKESNFDMYEQLLEEKFPDFTFQYYSVFKKLTSGEDIGPLLKILEFISNENTGKSTIHDVEKNVGSFLNTFLPPELLNKIETGEVSLDEINAACQGKTSTSSASNKKSNKNKNKKKNKKGNKK